MFKRQIQITNQTGLESKTAALLIQKASTFKSSIFIEKNERKANAKSLLGILSLSIADGDQMTLIVQGEDEQQAISELEEYIKSNLGEII